MEYLNALGFALLPASGHLSGGRLVTKAHEAFTLASAYLAP